MPKTTEPQAPDACIVRLGELEQTRRAKRDLWKEAKAHAKALKDDYEEATEELAAAVRAAAEPMPLYEGDGGGEASPGPDPPPAKAKRGRRPKRVPASLGNDAPERQLPHYPEEAAR